tara:strand:+ start:1186 stop:2454 length:1269 start_codon:yes stop_codon:yes gene_type:complete
MPKIFLIPIETSVRELDYKLLLSLKLAQKDAMVFLGSKGKLLPLIESMTNFNYLDKGYHKGQSENLYNNIKNRQGYIFSLDEEGAVDFNDNSSLKSRYSQTLFEQAERVYLWGKNQKEIYGHSYKNSIVTGHPRFEILKKKFRSIFSRDVRKLQKDFGDFILINTNMSFGNNIRGNSFVINNYEHRFPQIKKIIAQDHQKINIILETISRLLSASKKVILRPHPEESTIFYKENFKNNENFIINKSDSVIPWIIASKTVIHTDCTTALEAFCLDKIPISVLPKDLDETFICPLPLKISIESSPQQIVQDLDDYNFLRNKINSEVIEDNLSFSLDSLNLISDDLINKSQESKIDFKNILINIFKMKARDIFINNNDELMEAKLNGFKSDEINKKIENFSNILNLEDNFIAKKISDHLFEIKIS